jgi:hypothetical protein
MLTTLRTGALTLTGVEYKFDANNLLTIKIITDGNHKIYGDVNINLSNVADINIYNSEGQLVEDYFNKTFKFSDVAGTSLIYSETIKSGIAQTESFIELPNDGTDIVATVDNASIDLAAGTYNFLLLDTKDMEFSTSSIAIKEINIAGTGVNGLESVFYEEDNFTANPKEFSINNVDLTFQYGARVSLKNDVSGTTNIPLNIS